MATVLSAKSTYTHIHKLTEKLFKKYRTAEDYANADLTELESDLYSSGFYKTKAKNIKAAAQIIVEIYNGEVPKTMEELTSLSGIGRKTANIVLARAFGIVEGIAVDTHVKRVSIKLGFTKNSDTYKIEQNFISLALGIIRFSFNDSDLSWKENLPGKKAKMLSLRCEPTLFFECNLYG